MRNKSILLALVLLLTVVAAAKKETEADFDVSFTVTGTSQPVGNHYCPMILRAASIDYSVYAESWQCVADWLSVRTPGECWRTRSPFHQQASATVNISRLSPTLKLVSVAP
jgi:hypothetical protein